MADMSGPVVLRFKATLAKPRADTKTATGVVLRVPAPIGKQLGTMASAEGAINGHPFRATLEHEANGSYTIRVNQAMLRGAAVALGDVVEVAMLGPEAKLTLPADLRSAMDASGEATALWSDMSDIARRDYVRWIEATNNPQTRARRVKRTVEQLAEGKRRPCCVNTYEFSMSRIDPGWLTKTKRTPR